MAAQVVHILAFDDTDQAECRGDDISTATNERCTSNPTEVTCEHCLGCLDEIGRHP